jgi:YHS domain-containing protein
VSPRPVAVVAVVAVVAALAGCGPPRSAGSAEPLPSGAPIVDPVDGRRCARDATTPVAVVDGRNHYFCSVEARRRFAADPARFVAAPRP